MTSLQAHGPTGPLVPPPAPAVVVPVAPRRGWVSADPGRRVAAVLALPLAALLSVVALADEPYSAAIVVWTAVGPATFYSLARVLRPEPRHPERTPRHLLAGAATSFAVPTVVCLAAGRGDDLVIALGSPAFLLGVLTLLWGAAAFVIRATSS